MRILLTNLMLATRSGTETVIRDLALGLLRAGHQPAIYTRFKGPAADELRAHSIPVADRIENINGEFDIIHGHHLAGCIGALARFPDTPALFVCHDFSTWFDIPPKLPNIVRYAAVSENLIERLTLENGIDPARCDLMLNSVDLERFKPGPPAVAKPRRALIFAKGQQYLEAMRAACTQRGMQVDIVGRAVNAMIPNPEAVTPQYDLVLASDLTALEAMACGRPTIVVDSRGLAGMVDVERYERWRPHNFALKILTHEPNVDALLKEIDRYDPGEAAKVTTRVRAEVGRDAWIASYEALYEKAIREYRDVPATERAAQWAMHLQRWSPTTSGEWPWMEERTRLTEERDAATSGIVQAPLDRPLSFAPKGDATRFVAPNGFTNFEPWGMWSRHHAPSVRLRLPASPNGLTLDMAYAIYVPAADAAIDVMILANGEPLAQWRETGHAGWAPKTRSLSLPPAMCTGINTWLTFRTTLATDGDAKAAPKFPGLGLASLTLRAQR